MKQRPKSGQRPPLRTLVVCLCAVWLVCAQAAIAQRGVGNVSGKVVSAQGGQPIRKVTVRLTEEVAENAEVFEVMTDAAGEFRVEGVPRGEYTVTLERKGYFVASQQERALQVTVESGQEVAGLLYKMDAAGVITGKITDADGEPLVGIPVLVMRRRGIGETSAETADKVIGRGMTNDIGEFRAANVPAGMYAVVAMPLAQQPVASAAENGRGNPARLFVDTFFPGVPNEKQAGVVAVKTGETTTANFALLTGETYRVSGTLVGVEPGQVTGIVLMSDTGATFQASVNRGGEFAFASVRPGTYQATLVLKRVDAGGKPRQQSVRTPIEVINEDVVDLQLQAETRGTVSGKFRMDAQREEKVDWTLMMVTLVPVVTAAPAEVGPETVVNLELPSETALNEDGSFEVKDVAEGKYWLQVEARSDLYRDAFTKSVMADGRETVDTGFEANGGATLEVMLSTKGATLEGTVLDTKGFPVVDAYVVTAPSSGKAARPGAYQRVQTKAKGQFELHGLNPGEFVVVALEKEPEDVRSEEFLKKYGDKGVKVSVEEGTRKSVELVAEER
jgi:5-hydroxyisourate hydrolase-like protein (transthyretin family)